MQGVLEAEGVQVCVCTGPLVGAAIACSCFPCHVLFWCRYSLIDLDQICKNLTPNPKPGRKKKLRPGLVVQNASPLRGEHVDKTVALNEPTPGDNVEDDKKKA